MIDQLTQLTNKTNELENIIQNLTDKQKFEESQVNCLSYTRNFSGSEIILPRKFLVARIETQKNSNILFQCQIDITLTSQESVEISFIANGFSIYKANKILSSGSNQVSIMQNFQPLSSEKVSLYIQITPISQVPVILNNITLFAWGSLNGSSSTDYDVIELSDKYLLSVIDNNCSYYLLTDKLAKEFNLTDFNFIDSAISHSFIYSSFDNSVYYFRVDLNGNLFYSNFQDRNEKYLASDVSYVSADVSSIGKILVTYIKNNECYYFEISSTGIASIHRKLYCNNVPVSKVKCYYNSFRNKFLVFLSTNSNNNYLTEELSEDFSKNDLVEVEYDFYITTEDIVL